MNEPLVLLVVGFVLTSVVGGALTWHFQQRAWRHQYEVERRDQRHQLALKTFEELSALLDQRLYRMRLVYWAAKRRALAKGDLASVDATLTEYRSNLRLWNDNLNRNLALVETYFGSSARQQFERNLLEEYAAIGAELDDAPMRVRPVGRRLSALGNSVYRFNLQMLNSIRDGTGPSAAGAYEQTESARSDSHQRILRFGHVGDDVSDAQRALIALNLMAGQADGVFGRDTGSAIRATAFLRTA